jgi:NAD(P)H-nitrite reductase large subunit
MSPRYIQARLVCHCLNVTEADLREASHRCQLKSVHDAQRETGAGGGCTACHRLIEQFLQAKV